MMKFDKVSRSFLDNRKELEKNLGYPIWNIADNFGLYSGKETIARQLAVYEIYKKTLNVPGHVVEFGSWNGNNLLFLAKIMEMLQPNSYKELYSFDTFEGLQTFSEKDGEASLELRGEYNGNHEILKELIKLHNFDEWVNIVKGDILETLPIFLEANVHVIFSFIYIDVDLYDPTIKILEECDSRLASGGVIVFDEAIHELWKGETTALLEYLSSTSKSKYEMGTIPFAKRPTMFLTKK